MFKRDRSLLAQIEHDALDEGVLLTSTLRKCVALGGQTRSAELREWANQELHGYRNDDEIPKYRIIHAPLTIEGVTMTSKVTQQISSFDLPEFARAHIGEEVKIAYGIGDLQALLRNAGRENETSVKLGPHLGADVVKMMNHERRDPTRVITALYWDVNTARLEGILDQVRTKLVSLVSEMRAAMSDDELVPSPEQAAQAVSIVLHGGNRNQVNVTTAQANGSATAHVATPSERRESGWTKTAAVWTVIAALASAIGAYIAYRQWLG